jgi:hypothetical protein
MGNNHSGLNWVWTAGRFKNCQIASPAKGQWPGTTAEIRPIILGRAATTSSFERASSLDSSVQFLLLFRHVEMADICSRFVGRASTQCCVALPRERLTAFLQHRLDRPTAMGIVATPVSAMARGARMISAIVGTSRSGRDGGTRGRAAMAAGGVRASLTGRFRAVAGIG